MEAGERELTRVGASSDLRSIEDTFVVGIYRQDHPMDGARLVRRWQWWTNLGSFYSFLSVTLQVHSISPTPLRKLEMENNTKLRPGPVLRAGR